MKVGILGFGTVGSGTYRMLQENREAIERNAGVSIEVVKIGIRDAAKPRDVAAELFTTDLDSIVRDPAVEVILELIGGIDPAEKLVRQALANGKNVVTANKELMAKCGSDLVSIAREKGLDMHYEAAVGGGIPLVQPLKHQLAGNDVLRMMGILNGTTNFILTKMSQEGADFADVLAEAQALGYAEADPTNDVDGFDTMYKISILASIAFGHQVPVDCVYREGIREISAADMHFAEMLGYAIKLLGVCELLPDGQLLVRVHPTLLPKDHPLAAVNGVYNALWLHGDFVGDVMFSGRGAGANPTASAVMGDLIDIGRNLKIKGPGSAIPYSGPKPTAPIDCLESRYYLRVKSQDRPMGLGQLATCFGQSDVSIAAMEMRQLEDGIAEIVFLTHRSQESSVRDAIVQIESMGKGDSVQTCIRVEGDGTL
ncbi:MAG: homoserine dehydrogenase [Armatimonadetes bacterium]|nr:homoserine dehydrogenase [Armatimonadota bacterium]